MLEMLTQYVDIYIIKTIVLTTVYAYLFVPIASYKILTDLSKIFTNFGIDFNNEDRKLCRRFIDTLFTALLFAFVLLFLLALVFLKII